MGRSPLAWLVRLVALLALFAGRSIVIPGVDPMALQAMQHAEGLLGLFNIAGTGSSTATLFEVAMMPLLVVSLVLVALASSDPRVAAKQQRIGALVYLAWCTVTAYSQALSLEVSGRGFGSDLGMVLVPDGGLRFRALAVLTWVAAAALLWFLAQWVTERGEVLGAVLFAGVLAAVHDVELLQQAWRMAKLGEPFVTPLAHALPWMVGLAGLWWAAPKQWPVQAPANFSLRSPLEALLLPLAVGQAVRSADFVALPLSIGLAIVVLVALNRDRRGHGHPLYLVGALVLPGPAIALILFPLVSRELEAREPGPFAGGGRFEVELACTAGNDDVTRHDARIFEERLRQARVKSNVRPAGAGRIRLTLEQIDAPQEVVAAITPPYRLAMQLVARDQSMLSVSALDWKAAGLTLRHDYDGEAIAGPTPESLGALLAEVHAPEGFEVSIECRELEGVKACSPMLLETAGMLEGSTIREASVTRDQRGEPVVSLVFNEAGAERLSQISSEPGRRLAIVLDGRILSAPTINGRIDGGRASITMGRTGRPGQQLLEAKRLANGLQSEPLQCQWHTASLKAN